MILAQQSEVGRWTGPKCGNVYNVFSTRSPVLERPSLNCDCGETIVWGRPTTGYERVLVGKADPGEAAKNPPSRRDPSPSPLPPLLQPL